MPRRQPAHPFGTVAHPDDLCPVTPEGLKLLRGFLDATDWRCIYGINMGTNVPSSTGSIKTTVAELIVVLPLVAVKTTFGWNVLR